MLLIVFDFVLGLPSGNPTSTITLMTEGGTGAGTHGSVACGSSLPHDKNEPSSKFIEQLTKLNKLEMTEKTKDVVPITTSPNTIVESLQRGNKLEYTEKKDEEIKKKFDKEEIVEKSGLVIPVNSDDKQILVLEKKNEKVIHSSDISEVEEKLGEKEMPEKLLLSVSEKSDSEQIPMLEETAEKMISSGSIPTIEENLDKKETSEKSIVVTSEKSEYEQILILEEKAENVVDSEMEFRLTMISSVREAVNKICEQAVERTTEIVKSGYGHQKMASSIRSKRDAANDSDAEFSDFSLPPPPPTQSATTITDHLVSTLTFYVVTPNSFKYVIYTYKFKIT